MMFLFGPLFRDLLLPWFPFLRDTQLLLQWGISAGLLLLAVLALRRVLRGKLSPVLTYALWAVVLLRLVIPAQLPALAPVSAAQLTPQLSREWETHTIPVYPSTTQSFDQVGPYEKNIAPGYLGPTGGSAFYIQRSQDGETVTTYVDMFSPGQVLQSIWWTGVLVAGGVFLISNLRFAAKLKKGRQRLALAHVPLPVYVVEGPSSPFLFGLLRPAIYLTPQAMSLPPDQLDHILTHELTHYAHGDHFWALGRCVCLALHWYNPLVWLAALLSKEDGERTCDQGAVARLGQEQRIAYGRTLVALVAQRPRGDSLLSCSTAMTAGKRGMQERISVLVSSPKTIKSACFVGVTALALALVFTFVGRSPAVGSYDGLETALDGTVTSEWMVAYDRQGPLEPARGFYPTPPQQEQLKSLLLAGEGREGLASYEQYSASPHQLLIILNPPDSYSYGPDWERDQFNYFSVRGGTALYLSEQEDGCHLAEAVNGGFHELALLPAGTVPLLKDMVWSQNFFSQLYLSTGLRVIPPLYSSIFYPDPISDADLLEQAKALFSVNLDLGVAFAQSDWSQMKMDTYTIVLSDGAGETRYYLYSEDTYDLLVVEGTYGPEVAQVLPSGTRDHLFSLAGQQCQRNVSAQSTRYDPVS